MLLQPVNFTGYILIRRTLNLRAFAPYFEPDCGVRSHRGAFAQLSQNKMTNARQIPGGEGGGGVGTLGID